MTDLKLYFPTEPFLITQPWGAHNSAYSQQFNDPSFKRHNGIDFKPQWGAKTYPVYCPVEGFVVAAVEYQPKGGGHQIYLRSKSKFKMFDQECYVGIYLLHAEKILVPAGYEPALDELLMIADNTGFSTGPHTHMGLYRLNDMLMKLDTNEATGSFDPSLFFTGTSAVDQATLPTLIRSNLRYYQYMLGLSA
jgi:murein DD-endopeptidase MepM/ murein hydrolase activator NlpD